MPRTRSRAWGWLAAIALAALGGLTAVLVSTSAAGAAGPAATSTTTASTTTASTTGTTTTAPTTTQATKPPQSSSLPSISGVAKEGQTFSATSGSWISSDAMTFAYQWRRCDPKGGSCSDIVGATGKTYGLKSVDVGDALRVAVTATNKGGSTTAVSPPTAVVAGNPAPAPTGCPAAKAGQVVDIAQVSTPARLQIAAFQADPPRVTRSMQQFRLRVVVDDTCGHHVKGALVYATGVPYAQLTIPPEQLTGSDGSVTLVFNRASRFPASARQQLLVLFIRARRPGNPNVLAGISTRRLVSIPVGLTR